MCKWLSLQRVFMVSLMVFGLFVSVKLGAFYLLLEGMIDIRLIFNGQHKTDNTMKVEKVDYYKDYDRYYQKYPGFSKQNTGWFRYRLGDMFRLREKAENVNWGFNYHKTKFPNSIATQYLSASNATHFNNFHLLLNIVKHRSLDIDFKKQYNVSFVDTIIVHLRTGDVIDFTTQTVDEILMDQVNIKYHKPKIYYINFLKKLKKFHLKKVLFITGYHFGTNHTKSIIYTIEIMKLFELKGYKNIQLRVNENPEIDFLIMCNSKYFIQSGGSFSRIIAKLVGMKGGKVCG